MPVAGVMTLKETDREFGDWAGMVTALMTTLASGMLSFAAIWVRVSSSKAARDVLRMVAADVVGMEMSIGTT